MTVDQLVIEARRHKRGSRPRLTQGDLVQALRMIVQMLLDNIDYEKEPQSPPAFFARTIATIVATLEDRKVLH